MARARRRTFERNSFLFYADSAADTAFLIRTGQVRCFVIDAEGHETTTAILGPGQFVGTETLTGRAAYEEFCEALTHVETWSLAADELRRASLSSPAIQGWLLGSLGKRLELTLTLRRGIALLSAPERVADIQVRLPALSGVDARTVRQTSLASLLQIRPETLARAHRPGHRSEGGEPWDPQILGSVGMTLEHTARCYTATSLTDVSVAWLQVRPNCV